MNFCPFHNQNHRSCIHLAVRLSLRELVLTLPTNSEIFFEVQDGKETITSTGLRRVTVESSTTKLNEQIEFLAHVAYDYRKKVFKSRRVEVAVLQKIRNARRKLGSGKVDLAIALNAQMMSANELVTLEGCGQRGAQISFSLTLEFKGQTPLPLEHDLSDSCLFLPATVAQQQPRIQDERLPPFILTPRDVEVNTKPAALSRSFENSRPKAASPRSTAFNKAMTDQQKQIQNLRLKVESMTAGGIRYHSKDAAKEKYVSSINVCSSTQKKAPVVKVEECSETLRRRTVLSAILLINVSHSSKTHLPQELIPKPGFPHEKSVVPIKETEAKRLTFGHGANSPQVPFNSQNIQQVYSADNSFCSAALTQIRGFSPPSTHNESTEIREEQHLAQSDLSVNDISVSTRRLISVPIAFCVQTSKIATNNFHFPNEVTDVVKKKERFTEQKILQKSFRTSETFQAENKPVNENFPHSTQNASSSGEQALNIQINPKKKYVLDKTVSFTKNNFAEKNSSHTFEEQSSTKKVAENVFSKSSSSFDHSTQKSTQQPSSDKEFFEKSSNPLTASSNKQENTLSVLEGTTPNFKQKFYKVEALPVPDLIGNKSKEVYVQQNTVVSALPKQRFRQRFEILKHPKQSVTRRSFSFSVFLQKSNSFSGKICKNKTPSKEFSLCLSRKKAKENIVHRFFDFKLFSNKKETASCNRAHSAGFARGTQTSWRPICAKEQKFLELSVARLTAELEEKQQSCEVYEFDRNSALMISKSSSERLRRLEEKHDTLLRKFDRQSDALSKMVNLIYDTADSSLFSKMEKIISSSQF